MAPAPAETVLTFLASIGSRADAELYVDLFRKLPKESFATIAAEASLVGDAGATLAERLRFLAEVDLFAPVVVGVFEPERAKQAAGELAERLSAAGLSPEVHDATRPGLAETVRALLRAERTPVVSFEGAQGGTVASRFVSLGELATQLETRKLVLLRRAGALGPHGYAGRPFELPGRIRLPMHDEGISVINARDDVQPLRESGLLSKSELGLLEAVENLIERPDGPTEQVSIASPFQLLRELFTVKGAGTLVRRGALVTRHGGYDTVDRARLQSLLESSFGKPLSDTFFTRPVRAVVLEDNYRGVAIVAPSEWGGFLTKFAVDRVAQGEGIGRDLWKFALREEPALFWRARPTNPIGPWYTSVCDGMVRTTKWQVFWRGIEPGHVPALVDWAIAAPEDF